MMDEAIVVRGGRRLAGTVHIVGAKNAVLPLLAASVLSCDEVVTSNCPYISDVDAMCELLDSLGARVARIGRSVRVGGSATCARVSGKLAKVMRSSMFLLGALLASVGEAHVPLPGGCDIGERPLDIHIDGLKKLGAEVKTEDGMLDCYARELVGADIVMRYPSVGATENLMLCATLAKGRTRLIGCAREPEIRSLARGLNAMGARIRGEGSSVIEIEGVNSLHGAELCPCGDRIVAGTVIAATSAAGGQVDIYGVQKEDLAGMIDAFSSDRCAVEQDSVRLRVTADGLVRAKSVITSPFPLFPTDMQAQFMAAQCFSDGVSVIDETVFERRFAHARELVKMGADITLDGRRAIVRGSALTGARMRGARMYARDLRGGAGLLVAALAAEGESVIFDPRFIDRGYERVEELFSSLGADVERINI